MGGARIIGRLRCFWNIDGDRNIKVNLKVMLLSRRVKVSLGEEYYYLYWSVRGKHCLKVRSLLLINMMYTCGGFDIINYDCKFIVI